MQEKLSFASPGVLKVIDISQPEIQHGTHVVTGIQCGLRTVLATKHDLTNFSSKTNAEKALRCDLNTLRAAITSGAWRDPDKIQLEIKYEYTIYSDALGNQGLAMSDLSAACTFIGLVPDHLREEYQSRGRPISYTLLPLSMLQYFVPTASEINSNVVPISAAHLTKFINVFDDFVSSEEKLRCYLTYLENKKHRVSEQHLKDVSRSKNALIQSRQHTESELRSLIVGVRAGDMDVSSFLQLYEHATRADLSPMSLASIGDKEWTKLEFLDEAVLNGAAYIGYNGVSLQKVIRAHRESSCYIFLFSNATMADQRAWSSNANLVLQLLAEKGRVSPVYVVDCSAKSSQMDLKEVRICKLDSGREIIPDLLRERQFAAEKCFVHYDKRHMDTTWKHKPVKRAFVKIPCPGRKCDPNQAREWICSRCLVLIECGYQDDYIYCDCGRSLYMTYTFKCNGSHHGTDFVQYDDTELLRNLESLDQSNYLNILILGETGVGKSTYKCFRQLSIL